MRIEEIREAIAARSGSLPFGVHEFYAGFVPHCGWMELDTAQEWDSHHGPREKINVFKYKDSNFDYLDQMNAHVGVYRRHLAAHNRMVVQRRAKKEEAELREFRQWRRSRKR